MGQADKNMLLQIANDDHGTMMTLQPQAWHYFIMSRIKDRVQDWCSVSAHNPSLRTPSRIDSEDERLILQLPALSTKWALLPELMNEEVQEQDKVILFASFCRALGTLHLQQFVYGFFAAESIYVHRDTMQVCLDVQPFDTTYPFVNHQLEDYPFEHLPWHSRFAIMPRLADIETVGIVLDFLFRDGLPSRLRRIRQRLHRHPESILFLDHIADEICSIYGIPVPTSPPYEPSPSSFWLHPADSPFTLGSLRSIQTFLRDGDELTFAIIEQDSQLRTRLLHQQTYAVLNLHVFITINCTPMPLSTWRQGMQQIMDSFHHLYPEARGRFRSIYNRLHYLLNHFYSGEDILEDFADWLFDLTRVIFEYLSDEHLYFVLEDCHQLDSSTLEVFNHFRQKYGSRLSKLHFIISGESFPKGLKAESVRQVSLMPATRRYYIRTIRGLLGEADEEIITLAAEDMLKLHIHPSQASTMLNQWLASGKLSLTSKGWHWQNSCSETQTLHPDKWVELQVRQLLEDDLYQLAVLSSLPTWINIRSLAVANNLSLPSLIPSLLRLVDAGLIEIISWNCLLVLGSARRALEGIIPEDMRIHSQQEAYTLFRNWKPKASSILLNMAQSTRNRSAEYYYLIRYYRENRSVLMLEQAHSLLADILELHHALKRPASEVWLRKQITTNQQLGDWAAAEHCAKVVYDRTGNDSDQFRLLQIQLIQNKLDLPALKPGLFEYMLDSTKSIPDRAHAFYVLIWYWAMVNLSKDERRILHETYVKQLYPNRNQLKREIYLLISTRYAQFLLEFFPEEEEWALSLLSSLEALIEHTGFHTMKLRVYAAYMFHKNMRNARNYILKSIEGAQRLGISRLVHLSQANGAETAMYVGDIRAFWYHREKAGSLNRKDWESLSIESIFLYCCEWNDPEQFEQLVSTLNLESITPIARAYWEITRRYLDFQRGRPMVEPALSDGDDQERYFMMALHASANHDNPSEVARLWKACIQADGTSPNGIRMMTGWSYRELIRHLLVYQPDEASFWLIQFKNYISNYGFYLFWPDYNYYSAQMAFLVDQSEDGLSLLDRAIKGYRLQGKKDISDRLEHEFQSLIVPAYFNHADPLLQEPKVQFLLRDREAYIRKSMRLLLNLRLSEQLPETPDINKTMEKLIQLLFEYFPVEAIVIDYQLRVKQVKQAYTTSGVLHQRIHEHYVSAHEYEGFYADLYSKSPWRIGIQMHLHHMEPWDKEQLESVLNMVRPHISASVLILEMGIDDLTSLYLRNFFLERLRQEFELSKRFQLDLSVLMIDLDNFRLINEYGHQEGDRVLMEVADVIRHMIGPYAVPGRYGGEEFIVILPKTGGSLAMRIAEQLRRRIEQLSEERPYVVSASIGVSSLSWSDAATPDELIRLADEAEIHAKKMGKNQVVAARL
ncbi:diguanylate cyclase (GGDEF)-like protein [Paenibacillus shirakamiensis]|uniref:Diguanylate cyclase (GGDEF)-like protein n=1 Tax=Paenibacillus shirakamiensis TaxID=1265935 RepID=A0ABS4JIB9_9BACL|nr:GGDEF domain-containing protein [Paenibacillus shirakamiensis]MBP2001448.1 diguanylate cyclase (GGDEF)-like protein [Paenibacillus shirakamiensis]